MLKDNRVFLSLPAHGLLIIRSLGLSIVDRLIPTDLAICALFRCTQKLEALFRCTQKLEFFHSLHHINL
jgi:hypothetical protein